MYFDNSYKGKNLAYPSHEVDPENKGAEWHLQFAKALYANFINDNCSSKSSSFNQMRINRLYGAGKQDTEQYKDILIGKKEQADAERKGWANVDFNKIISVAPKFRRIMVGIFLGQDHEVECNAIDESAGEERLLSKWRTWVNKTEKNVTKIVDSVTGSVTPESEYEPSSIEELELYDKMGGFKLKLEIAIENALKAVDYDSDWKSIKKKILGDAIDNGLMVVKDYVDVYTQKIKKRYVDIENFMYVLDEDGKVSKAAEVRYYTIENIRSETGLSEEDIQKIALDVRGKFGNSADALDWSNIDPKTGAYSYNDFIVPVLEIEVLSIDSKYRTERKMRDGGIGYFDEPWRTTKAGKTIPPKVWDTDGKRTKRIDVRVFRKCKWIIGSEICWDWGLSYDIPRLNKWEALSSYHVERLDGTPIIEACIPNFDNIQIANLRIQNGLAMAPNSGIAYEWSSLQGMSIGSKALQPMDIIKMHRQSGSFIYKATVHRGGMMSPMAGRPIQELTGGIGGLLGECITIINMNLETIRDVTGIGQGVDASNPSPDMGLGVMQEVVSATNNSLRPIYDSYISVKEKSSRNSALRVQIVARNKGGYWSYADAIGSTAWEVLDESADFSLSQIGIKITALPTQRDILDMEDKLSRALQAGQAGKPTITMSEYFAIKRILRSGGGLKFAQVLLAHRESKRIEAEAKAQVDNMTMNSENQLKAEAAKSDTKLREITLESQLKKEEETHKTNEAIRLEERKSQLRKEEIAVENESKSSTAA